MARRKPRPDARSLVMPPGRGVPRPEPAGRKRREAPPDDVETSPDVRKAAGELNRLAADIRACEACEGAGAHDVFGTGFPRAPIMLLKDAPSASDIANGGAFTDEAEPLAKAFEALGIPLSWVYGTTTARCATHLSVEIEAVSPTVIVGFGAKTVEALRVLEGSCGIGVPDEVEQGRPVRLRSDLMLVATEDLPRGLDQKDAKRRLWRDLKAAVSTLEA